MNGNYSIAWFKARKKFYELMKEAVDATKPTKNICVWSSGGVDSSALLWLLRDYDPTAIHINFEGEWNALELFNKVTKRLSISGRVQEMKLGDHFTFLPQALKNQGSNMNAFPTVHYYTALVSSTFDKVYHALGMDEMLGGYPKHVNASDYNYPEIEKLYFDMLPRREHNVGIHAEKLGLKVETPFLNSELIEFCKQMPRKFKMKGLKTKLILRDLMKGKIPYRNRISGEIAGTKGGFHPPIKEWWRQGLGEWVRYRLSFWENLRTKRNLWKKTILANLSEFHVRRRFQEWE